MAEQNITIKQKNSSGSYDTLYPATTVNQLSGVLPESKGGTGATSLSAMLTAAGGARIQTGSYTGTGTYGPSNPNSLTFNFTPNMLMIFSNMTGYPCLASVSPWDCGVSMNSGGQDAVIGWEGNTVSWYNDGGTSATYTKRAYNHNGTTYYYVVFGW